MDAERQQIDCSSQSVDPLSLSLQGRTLLEASAGTGKTYTLSLLYVRLLLGVGNVPQSRPLSVSEILVVTFTNAATEELRYKIRETLHAFRIACLRGYHPDPTYQRLLDTLQDRKGAAEMLLLAEHQMDDAAIYTIHGFCQRVLMMYALETEMAFEHQITHHMRSLYRDVAQMIWRRFFNPLPKPIAKEIKRHWSNPDVLTRAVLPQLRGIDCTMTDGSDSVLLDTIIDSYTGKQHAINDIKRHWLTAREDIERCIQASDVNKRSYTKKNLVSWLKAVDLWASVSTDTFLLPPALIHFSQHTLNSKSATQPPQHPIFMSIENLLQQPSLVDSILPKLVKQFAFWVTQEKKYRAEIESDDLLTLLKKALLNSQTEALATKLAKTYPAALIDEFQDTDATQYTIFDRIYQDRNQTSLLFIGDPKQSIYQFRGADIFVYMRAKQQVDQVFTLETNWRSCAELILATNALFGSGMRSFQFDEIPFYPVNAAAKKNEMTVECNGQRVPAAQYYCLQGMGSDDHYRQESARFTANYVHHLLRGSDTFLQKGKNKRRLDSADIAILVRNHREAECIKQALQHHGIASVFLSNRQSVFNTTEARELLWVLTAILHPQSLSRMQTALATRFFNVDMATLDRLQQHPEQLEPYVDMFTAYRQCWLRLGVMAMIRHILTASHIPERCMSMPNGERMLINLLHLAELLQTAAERIERPYALVNWLAKQTVDEGSEEDVTTLRLDSDANLVKIITIHKSKGLEYPFVFIPFLSTYKKATEGEYHDRVTYQRKRADKSDPLSLQLLDQERLAEDIRLCYVAMTRAIYACCLGLSDRSPAKLPWFDNGFGSLIREQRGVVWASLADALSVLPHFMELHENTLVSKHVLHDVPVMPSPIGTVCSFHRFLRQDWSISSYSSWKTSYFNDTIDTLTEALLPDFDTDALTAVPVPEMRQDSALISIHDLPRGAHVGTLLHGVLEALDFCAPLALETSQTLRNRLRLSEEWDPILFDWLNAILSTPLSKEGPCLNQIASEHKCVEMDFFIPIQKGFSAKDYHAIVQRSDPISAQCAPLTFEHVSGMLKGFIDLVFEWQGKFYIVDYKSNTLGSSEACYNTAAIEDTMRCHRYDVQYQLYTLALHRYLQQRIPNYDYTCHFGGIYYLFLRGMNPALPGNGVFFCTPCADMLSRLDRLFSGQSET